MSKWQLVDPFADNFGAKVYFETKGDAEKALRATGWALERGLISLEVPEPKPLHVDIIGHETAQVEKTTWDSLLITYRHRERASMTAPWSEWEEGHEND